MAGGRPTTYSEEMLEKAQQYAIGAWETDTNDAIPSVEGLCKYLGVARQTVYNWGEAHSDFLDTLEQLQEEQKCISLNKGLRNEFNSTITKLVLANHGMHDKQDNTHSGPDGGPVEWNLSPVSSEKD